VNVSRQEPRPVVDAIFWAIPLVLLLFGAFRALQPETEGLRLDLLHHGLGSAAISFSLLMAAVWRPVRGDGFYPHGQWWVVGTVALMGVLIEGIQVFIGDSAFVSRASLRDLAIDLFGALFGWALWKLLRLAVETLRDPA
jgi:VanZ family protein